MNERVVLIGGGGHASDVLSAFEAVAEHNGTQCPVIGLADDIEVDPSRFHRRGVRQIGNIGDLPNLGATHYVLAKGWPEPRQALFARIASLGLAPATVIHPRASLGAGVRIGEGTVVLAGAVISALTVVGHHAMVGSNATLGHDSEVGDFVSIMPSSTVGGDAKLGEACVIGANATVLQGRKIGAGAIVGAGAVVVRDVPEHVQALGVPARWSTSGLSPHQGISNAAGGDE